MAGRKKRPVAAEIIELREQIDDWRRSRADGDRQMPEDLWSASANLAEQHGVSHVARALGVGYYGLVDRMGNRNETDEAPSPQEQHDVGTFFELTGSQVVAGHVAGTEAIVEMADADGAWMLIRQPGHDRLDVTGLASSFWRRPK